MIVAVISQPLRIDHCIAWIRGRNDSEPMTLLVPELTLLGDTVVPTDIEVVATGAPRIDPLRDRILRSRSTKRLVAWSRAGTAAGARVERLARKVFVRTRPFDHTASGASGMNEDGASHLLRALERLDGDGVISLVVSFDLFDLPAIVEFARRHDVSICVR